MCLDFIFQAAKKTETDDWENWFSDQDKELQQIYQGQEAMREIISDLHSKMDAIIGRQERTLSLISQVKVNRTSQNYEM